MARKRARILADAINARLEAGDPVQAPRREYTTERESLISEASEGRLKNGKLRLVDPKSCRMWTGHNRLYDLLTPASCGDLIRSIKAVGRQEMPAIVRPLRGEDFEYEVICGARRHFAVSHLREAEHRTDIEYLVDIRDISDEEAFRLSDLENREREDISDFERSRDYGRALTQYYNDNKALMAERLGVDRTWLSRYLRIGELPQVVLDAYGDVRDIGIRHAAEISPLLSSDRSAAVLAEAEHIARSRDEGQTMPAASVLKSLKAAAVGPRPKTTETVADAEGKALFTVERKARTVVLTVQRSGLRDKAALLAAIEEALD
ncbi:MAG: ParB/RepB/Spo0J family partition protein [Parvularculaceae bacterium]|nr:ParB/RepB/Spo0J family partition protein [Parvularculaceae bacterium]